MAIFAKSSRVHIFFNVPLREFPLEFLNGGEAEKLE